MLSFNKFSRYLAIPALAMILLMPLLVWAQLPIPTVPSVPGATLTEIENLIRRVAQFFLIIGVIIAVIYIIWGGVRWMMAGGAEDKIKTAKTQIWSGVWGALVVIAVSLILQTLAGVVTRVFFQ